MPLVAKRKVTESWRDSVLKRGREFGLERECLAGFDTRLTDGFGEFEAAFIALKERGCLWLAPGPEGDEDDLGFDLRPPRLARVLAV